MSWEHRDANTYYYHKFRFAGKVRCCYLGRGKDAEEFVAKLDMNRRSLELKERLLRRKIAALCRWISNNVERITGLCSTVENLLKAAGFYRHRGQWRRRGPFTMRVPHSPAEISNALVREKARRYFDELPPEKLDAEITKYLKDTSVYAVNELIAKITPDPIQQEIQFRQIERVTCELAGPSPTIVVKMLARSVAVLSLERDLADSRFYRALGDPEGLSYKFSRDLLRWREFAHRKLNSTIRTLAYIRRIDTTSFENTLEQLRIAS